MEKTVHRTNNIYVHNLFGKFLLNSQFLLNSHFHRLSFQFCAYIRKRKKNQLSDDKQ